MKKIKITNGSDREIVDILVKDVDVESLMDQISFLSCQEDFDDKYHDAPGLMDLLRYMLDQAKITLNNNLEQGEDES
jgi:hypothetical protein